MTAVDVLVPPLPPAAGPARLRLVPPPAPLARSVWWARVYRGAHQHSVVVVASDRFPAGTAVDVAGRQERDRRPAGWLVDVGYRPTDGAVVRIDLPGDPGGGLWFTEVHHAGAVVPSVSLHAWTGGAGATGELRAPGAVGGATHVGEVRWWLRSGLVETVRVEQQSRGCGAGRALVVAAEGLRLVRGWAPLRADGRLTDAAAAWLASAPPCWTPRLAQRTQHLPPEPEPGTPAGVGRLLADLPTRVV